MIRLLGTVTVLPGRYHDREQQYSHVSRNPLRTPNMPRTSLTFLLLGIGALPTRAEPQALPVITTVTLNPSSVIGGATVIVIVTLSENAGQGGITMKLVSSNTAIATVPQSYVVVQPGTQTASFVVQTKPVAANPNVVTDPPFVDITAGGTTSSGGPDSPPHLLLSKSVQLIVLPPALASLTLSPSSVSGGTAATAEVRLTGPAPAGGVTVALTSKLTGAEAARAISPGTRQGPVSVPAQVTVPAGSTSTTFQVTTRRVTAATPAQVTAAHGAFNTKSATLTITP